MTQPLAGRNALVTGASGGIGRAIAQRLARAGARVIVHYHQQRDRAEELIAELSAGPGGDHMLVAADLCDAQAGARMVQDIIERVSRIDILVNNAGVYLRYPFMQTSADDWFDGFRQALAINLEAPARLAFQVGRHMVERGGGRIINIGSRGAFRGEPDAPGYGAAKAGLHSLTQSLAVALGAHGVHVFAVAPGFVETAMARPYLDSAMADAIRAQSPLGRVARVDDVAYWVECLARDEAAFATGAIIDVNGASYLRM